jgi:predicted permease
MLSLRNGLIVGQVALSLVLLVTASLFLRSLQAANHVDVGFNPDNVATVQIDLTQRGHEEEQRREFFRRLRARVEALPNVTEVALASRVPLGSTHERWGVEVEGFAVPAGELAHIGVNVVSPEYLELMQMRLLSGRGIEATDRPGAPPIAVVNEAFARLYSPEDTPLGKHIRVDDSNIEIVGVVATAKYRNLSEDPEPRMWLPLAQYERPTLTLLARTSADPSSLLPLLRREVLGLDAELPLRDPALLEQTVATSMMPQKTASAALGSAGIVALVLAIIGIYGVVAVSVVRRTPELGVRIALGARRGDIVRMIVGEALAMVATGMAIGFAIVIAVTRLLTSVLMGVSPIDPLALLGGAALLGLAALLASLVPGLRASRVDPLVALRYE